MHYQQSTTRILYYPISSSLFQLNQTKLSLQEYNEHMELGLYNSILHQVCRLLSKAFQKIINVLLYQNSQLLRNLLKQNTI